MVSSLILTVIAGLGTVGIFGVYREKVYPGSFEYFKNQVKKDMMKFSFNHMKKTKSAYLSLLEKIEILIIKDLDNVKSSEESNLLLIEKLLLKEIRLEILKEGMFEKYLSASKIDVIETLVVVYELKKHQSENHVIDILLKVREIINLIKEKDSLQEVYIENEDVLLYNNVLDELSNELGKKQKDLEYSEEYWKMREKLLDEIIMTINQKVRD